MCTYDSSTGYDSCTAEGYECSAEFSTATPATCVLPEDLAVCDGDPNMDVGCQDGGIPNGMGGGSGDLFCSMGFQNANGPVSLCIYSCATADDCPSLTQICLSGIGGCFYNFCGFNDTGAFAGPFFGTCPVKAAGDGQCLEYASGPELYALCEPNGTAQLGSPCNPQYRFGAFSECTYGSYCVANSSKDGGLCFPITADGGCAEGEDSVSEAVDADWAVCATDCTTDNNCDFAPLGTSCQLPSGSSVSACLP